MASPLRDLSRATDPEPVSRLCYCALKYCSPWVALWALPISKTSSDSSFLVRYELIDSCSLANGISIRYARRLLSFSSWKYTRRREKKNEVKVTVKREKESERKGEVVLYRSARRNETEFMSYRGRSTYSSFESAMRSYLARNRRMYWSIKSRPSCRCIQRSAISWRAIDIFLETYTRENQCWNRNRYEISCYIFL